MREYSFNKRIDSEYNLAKLFNSILEELDTIRLLTCPSSTFNFQYSRDSMFEVFYHCCVTEVYFHSVFDNLLKWKKEADIYTTNFRGLWYAYALNEKINLNKEYGSEDDLDYNDDGSLRTNFTEDEVSGFTILDGWIGYNDIFLTAKQQDFDYLYRILENANAFSFGSMKRALGWDISVYKTQPDDTLEKMTWEEEILSEVEDQYKVDSLSEYLKIVIANIVSLVEEVEALNRTEDNKEFFELLPSRIDRILNLDIL